MASKKARLREVIARLDAAVRQFYEKEGDAVRRPKAHPPASAAAIARYEEYLGQALPPSYRAFLELHDGYDWLAFPGSMLSIEDVMPGGRRHDAIKTWKKRMARYGGGEVLDGIVIANLDQPNDWVYLDPNRPGDDGELTVVEWEPEDSDDYPDLVAYFEECIATCTGTSEDEDEDEGEDDED